MAFEGLGKVYRRPASVTAIRQKGLHKGFYRGLHKGQRKQLTHTIRKRGLFNFLGDAPVVHYAELIPPLYSSYTGPEPYTALYPATTAMRARTRQLTPEEAYSEQVAVEKPMFRSYNPFAGLGYYETPGLDTNNPLPPPPPAPEPVVVSIPKPVSLMDRIASDIDILLAKFKK